LGFGVGGSYRLVFEDVGEAGGGEGLGFGGDEISARNRDTLDGGDGFAVGLRFEQVGELEEGDLVDVAHGEGGDGGVEEVFEEVV